MLIRKHQHGFTMVEVMVTVFVVAIGALAAAALQAVAKKAAMDAMQRTTATVIAQDMIERIRANQVNREQYNSKTVDADNVPSSPSCGSGTTACESTTTLIDYDLAKWWESLDGAAEQIDDGSGSTTSAGGLRDPVGCVRVTGNQVTVVVAWRGLTKIAQGAEAGDSEDPTTDACGLDGYEFSNGESYRRVLRLVAYV